MVDMSSSFTRRSNTARELEPVAITDVDPATRTAYGMTRVRTRIQINCAFATGDTITTPAKGEQWYVERVDMEWRLYGRIPFNDATLAIEPEEGQVSVGSASGPLELNGTEIRANGASFRLNGAYYRDDGATLLRSTDGDLWEPIFANATGNGTAGVLQMLAHRLADIPVTPEVTEYLGELSDAEAAALTDLAQWADGLQETIGGGWDVLCNNPFFANLREMGDGDSPLDEIVTGLQNFLNDLTGLLFCQFQGDVTPQALTGAFGGLQEVFTGDTPTGDFLRGLQGLLPIGDQANNLLLDSVNGAVKFVQDLFDILFCTETAVPIDPAAILAELGTIFDPLKNNPFLLGLQEVFTDAGNAATNLFTDSIEGTVKIIQDLFGAVFCGVDLGDEPLTPQTLFEKLNEGIIEPLRDNPFIQSLTDLAERMGIEFNNNLTGAISGAVEFLQLAVGVVTCNLTPAQVTKVDDFIETATGGLLPADIFDFLQNKLIKPLNNSFVQGLAEMFRATNNLNRSLLEDAVAGAEQLIEVVQDIFTCNADGTLIDNIKALVGPGAIGVTPAKLVKLLDDFFGTFRDNPFVLGLQNFWTTLGNQASTVAQDAVRGATEFFQYVFDLLLCKPGAGTNLTAIKNLAGSNFTPAKIIADIDDFFDGFRSNPFVTGLQNIWTSLGNTTHGLLRDVADGVTEFFQVIFGALNCDTTQLLRLNTLAGSAAASGSTPVGILASLKQTFLGADGNGGLLGNSWVQIFNNIANREGFGGNLLNRITDGFAAVADFFFDDVLDKLFPALNLKDLVTNFPNGIQDWLEDLDLAKLLDPLGLGQWFNENIFTPIVRRITGDDNRFTLDDLANFFDPSFFSNVFKDIVEAITTSTTGFLSGPIRALADFFDFNRTTIGSGAGIFGGLPTLFNTLVEGMIGSTVLPGNGPLAKLTQLFSGVTLTGGKSLLSQLGDRINEFGDTLGINSIVSAITGVNIDELENSYVLTVTGSPTGGTFTLSYGGQTTAPIAYSTTAATTADNIEAALTALSTIGTDEASSTVTFGLGAGVKFTIGIANTDSTLTVGSNSLTGGTSPALTLAPKFQGPLQALSSFFNGFNPFNGGNNTNLLQQILEQAGSDIAAFVSRITGIPQEDLLDPLGAIQRFFEGLDDIFDPISGDNSLIKQIVSKIVPNGSTLTQLNTFFSNLRGLFGMTGTGPLADILSGDFLSIPSKLADAASRFVNTFLSKAGTGAITNIAKIPGNILAVGINNIENLISTLTGGTSLTQFSNFFANLRKFLNIGTGGTNVVNFFADPNTFSIPAAIDGFIKNIIKTATAIGEIPSQLISAFSPAKIEGLIEALTGKTVDAIEDDIETFFNNLRRMFNIGSGTGQINLLDPTATLTALRNNFFNFVSNLTTGINSFLTQAGLNNWLGGGLNLTEIGNWFTNLTKFFGIGDFKLTPTGTGSGVFDLAAAAGKFIRDVINQASGFLINPLKVLGINAGNLSDDLLARPMLSTLLGWITGSGTVNAFDTFFTNIKNFFGNGINLLGTTFNASTAQQTLTNIIKTANDTVEAFISKSGLQSWLGAINLGEIGNWFTNLTKFFKIGEFKLAPGIFDIGIAAGNFINDIINQATNFLISPLKVLGIGGSNLSTDLSARPILTDLRTWLTTANGSATEDIQRFFTNLRTTLGINFLPSSGTFNASDAQKVIHDVIANVNSTLSAGQKWVTQSIADAKATISDIVKKITGIDNAQNLDPLGTFFGSFTSQATTLIGKVIDQITGLITNGLGGLNLTQFFSGFNGASTATDSLAYKISQAVSGGAATALGQVNTFFANLRSFLGGGSGFLSGTFDLKTTVENFISNVLKAPTIGINLVTTGINNLLSGDIIPNLPIAKISDLTRFLTGSATAVAADVERFFTNLRGMFGGNTNLLGTTFNFADAANQFITNVLSKAGTGLSALIPEHALSALGIGKITNLINFVTGATGSAASNPDTLKNFFAGFAPFTGLNTIVNQITQSIFGTGGTLSQLQSFFSGLGGAFNPSTGAGSIVQQFVQQITGKVGGVLADIGSFLGIGPATDSTTFNPFTGANNLINQIVTKIIPAGTNLVDMTTFFTNLRNLFGTTNFLTGSFDFPAAARAFIDNVLSKVSAVTAKIPGLAIGNLAINQITNLIRNITGVDSSDNTALEKFFSGFSGFDISTGANNLINQFVAKITGNNGQVLSNLTDFFNNLRNFLGFNPVSAGGSGTLGTAVSQFFDKLNNSGAGTRLNPASVLSGIGMGQITDLIGFITNGVGTVASDVQNFFTNLRNTLGLNFLPSSGTFNASAAQKIVHDVIANVNNTLSAGQKWATQAVADAKATISDIVQKITGTSGASNLDPIGNFFSGLLGSGGSLLSQFVSRITGTGSSLNDLNNTFANLRSFLGFSPLTTASPAASVNSFFGTLNGITPSTALNLNTVGTDLNIEKVASLASFVTGGGATSSAGVQTFFNNLRNFLGFNPFSTGGSGSFGTAVNTFFGNLNTVTPTTKLDPAKLLSNIGITQISNLVSSLTGTGSSATDLSTFFTNLRSTFNGINFLPGTTFNADNARRAIHDFVASINNGLAAGQKWATQAIADAKAGIADIVQRITGATGATDLSGIGNFFSGLAGGGNLVSQFVSRITSGGTTLSDLNSFGANLRGFLGFDPFSGFGNLTNAVSNFFNTINTTAPWVRLNPANLLSNIGMNQISEFITYVTGSSTNGIAQIQSFFNNLRNFLGFNPSSTGDLTTAVSTFFNTINATSPWVQLNPTNLLQDISPTKISNLVTSITGGGNVAADIQTFFTRLKSILGGVNPMSAASVAAEQSNLFTALNSASAGTLGTAKVAGVENATLGTDLRGVFSNIVLGLQGNPSSTAAGGTTPRLSDLFSTAKNTSDSISNIAQVISELQTTATKAANSGNSDFTVFPNFALWNNGGLTYSGTASGNPGSAVEAVNNQAVWKSYNGTTTRTARAVFTRTKTSTDYQRVGITFSSKPMGDWGGGASPAFNYILGRANNNSGVTTEYVFAKFSPTALSVGYTLNGGASETMFQTISHSFSPGATYWLECGTSGGQAVYRVLRGSEVLLTVTNTGFNAYTNADHRFGGFAMTGTWNNFWINEPGSMAAFAIADNTPATYLGSGFRRYRNAETKTISSIGTGNRLLPDNFFNTGDKITADYTYDQVGNKVIVSTEGWYQVNMNLALTTNTGTGAMQNEIAPLLYKNGAVDARGASAVGIGGLTARGPSQCAGAFQVYLKAGEYIQPGYWYGVVSSQTVTGTLTGDAAGHTCYLQVTFMNRSTTA